MKNRLRRLFIKCDGEYAGCPAIEVTWLGAFVLIPLALIALLAFLLFSFVTHPRQTWRGLSNP